MPLTKDPPIWVIKSPLRIFFNMPLTAFRTVSIKLLINVPIPSFKTSSIFKMADTIWPISPAFDNPSLSASPAFLPASAAASAASLPISFSPSAAFLASFKAFNPSIPPLSWSKLSQRDAKSDSPEVERNSWIAEIGCVTFCVVWANFWPLVRTFVLAVTIFFPDSANWPWTLFNSSCSLVCSATLPDFFAFSICSCKTLIRGISKVSVFVYSSCAIFAFFRASW